MIEGKKMKSKYWILILFAVTLLLGLAACTRSMNPSAASVTQPTATPATGAQPTTGGVMDQLNLFVTQTAMAAEGITGDQTVVVPTGGSPVATTVPQQATQATVDQPTVAPSATPLPTQVPSPTPRTVPTVTPGLPGSYTLRTGEHVYCISRRFDVNPEEVLQLNGIPAGTILRAGTELRIPQTGNPFPGNRSLKSHPTTYTVRSGDTIYSIACEFGDVEPWAIAYANNLAEPYDLNAGQELYIP